MDNINEMSVEELRQKLVASDEMVKQLEQKMKDMMEDSESSMMEKEDEDKEESMTEKEDETKLAHTPDHEEKKEYKMSESLTQSTLLSEVQSLRENNANLMERIAIIETEKRDVEKREAVNTLLNEGKIQPSEVSAAGKAFEIKDLEGEFWAMFSERPTNSAVPLVEVGHGASGQEINKATLDQEVRNLAKEKAVSYSEALNLFRQSNSDYYNSVFGG